MSVDQARVFGVCPNLAQCVSQNLVCVLIWVGLSVCPNLLSICLAALSNERMRSLRPVGRNLR